MKKITGMFAFTLMWLGQLVSIMGSAMSGFALGIWAWEKSGSATALALIGIFNFAPQLLFSPIAGALVDRWNRKLVLILSDLAAGATTIFILFVYLINPDKLQIWHLCLAGLISGTFQAFQWPAQSVAITMLMPKKHYARAQGMMSLIEWGAGVFSPILAATLFGLIGLLGILAFDIATFIFAILMVLIIIIPKPEESAEGKESKSNVWKESLYGFKYIWGKKSLLSLQLVFFFGNFLSTIAGTVLTPIILSRAAQTPELTLGFVNSAGSIGGIAGSILITAWGGFKKKVHGVLIGWTLSGLLGCVLFGITKFLPVWLVSSFFFSFFGPIINSSNQAIWMSKVQPDIQGKVFSARRFIAQMTAPIGMAVGGLLADNIFEPAMKTTNFLTPIFGNETGSGMSLLIVIAGLGTMIVGIIALTNQMVRDVETIIPDHSTESQEKIPKG